LSAIAYRDARPADVAALRELIFTHGPNPWNYLPEEGVMRHLEELASGRAAAVVACCEEEVIGFVSFIRGKIFPHYEPEATKGHDHGYIVEGVVHKEYAGRGIGTRLLEEAKQRLRALGVTAVYADRHEENLASAGIMRKAGFTIIDTFPEHRRRPHGSGRTSVGRCELDPDGRSTGA